MKMLSSKDEIKKIKSIKQNSMTISTQYKHENYIIFDMF